jgi:hypothetical protein
LTPVTGGAIIGASSCAVIHRSEVMIRAVAEGWQRDTARIQE